MKRISIQTSILLGLAFSACTVPAAVGTLSGPFTHRNLEIFLVHGDTQLEQKHYATLTEALEKGFVVVKETGNVQEVSIENRSRDLSVFLNSGDIVKGGRQDRTVREDLILPPQSGPVPLATFCVEHGRWTARGTEDPGAFSANTRTLSSRKEKLAARYGLDQSAVWHGVAEQQAKLNENLSRLSGRNVDTRSAASASSLQLTLESKELAEIKKHYLEKLDRVLDAKTDVIGFVYAINGGVNSAEVYNNKSLFRALWPKLLDAAVTEAITEYKPESRFKPVPTDTIKSFFETALSGAVKEREVWKTTRVRTYTTPTTLLFETLDLTSNGSWIHKTFIEKGNEGIVVPLDREGAQYQQQQLDRSHLR